MQLVEITRINTHDKMFTLLYIALLISSLVTITKGADDGGRPVASLASLADQQLGEEIAYFDPNSVPVLRQHKAEVLRGGGCVVVALFGSLRSRTSDGERYHWNLTAEDYPSNWASHHNGLAGWCVDSSPRLQSTYPKNSLTYGTMAEDVEDSAYLVFM